MSLSLLSPSPLADTDRHRKKLIARPGERISFEGTFLEGKRVHYPAPTGPHPIADQKAAMAQMRRQWADRKSTAYRDVQADTAKLGVASGGDARLALADVRRAALSRKANAYRGNV